MCEGKTADVFSFLLFSAEKPTTQREDEKLKISAEMTQSFSKAN